MKAEEGRPEPKGWRGRLASLPLFALVMIGVALATLAGGSGYAAYQAYDYVEHDNDFCFSCHLMQDPYEAFAQSAHRDLGCKDCHQPNLLERSQMGLTGILLDPDTLSVHAEVPNDLCADCHIRGDPEAWTLIAATAGHRVHLESDDPVLEGLQCVECHSSGIHEFTAVDETCAQSGCHTESTIQLGAMSDLTLHCVTCHAFADAAIDLGTAEGVLEPDQSDCFSCHVMQETVALPDPDPHAGGCGSCHNPHDQEQSSEAADTCATAGCHEDPASLTPHHVGLDSDVLSACTTCHTAHDFAIDGDDCVACHSDVFGDTSVLRSGPAHDPIHSWGYPVLQELTFRHSEHREVSCLACHDSSERHGAVLATTVADCRGCHHLGEVPGLPRDTSSPIASGVDVADCVLCHQADEDRGDPHQALRILDLSVGVTVERRLRFEHELHDSLSCAQCHDEGLTRPAAEADCVSCHEQHHAPTSDCMSCHVAEAAGSHRLETAHLTCSGSACHSPAPFDDPPRTREVCLGCHQDQIDHEPGEACARCHALPGSPGVTGGIW